MVLGGNRPAFCGRGIHYVNALAAGAAAWAWGTGWAISRLARIGLSSGCRYVNGRRRVSLTIVQRNPNELAAVRAALAICGRPHCGARDRS